MKTEKEIKEEINKDLEDSIANDVSFKSSSLRLFKERIKALGWVLED